MSEVKNYDNLLSPILHHEGRIDGFLDAVFEFLYRRTDFFRILKPGSEANIGLPPGAAENFVKAAFLKYIKKAEIDNQQKQDVVSDCDTTPLGYVREEEVTSEGVIIDEDNDHYETENIDSHVTADSRSEYGTENSGHTEKAYQSFCESYNGASYEKYSWSQNIKDVDILVKVPESIISGRQVKVHINQKHLKVDVLAHSEWEVAVDDDLCYRVNVEESVWTLVPHEHIHICLHKMQQRWWDACFASEPKIDVHKIDASQPYEDLDEESQAKIQELMYKEHLKRLGKHTEPQAKMAEILKEAWNLENSPFRGQPFDPSIISFSDGSEIPEMLKGK